MKRYDAYKDSGVEWLGEVPEHWGVKRIKDTVIKIGNGVTPKGGSEVYTDVGIPFIRSQNVYDDGLHIGDVSFISDEIHRDMKGSQLKEGDILINITGASIGRTCVVPIELGIANINQHVAFLRTKYWFNTTYISLFLKSPFIKKYIQFEQNGASKEAFNLTQIANIPIVLPNVEEQTAIANYLDTKTTQIDHKINLLTQKATQYGKLKQSLINETVTRGLDKTVAMKDSGVEWIGEVPEHWGVELVKRSLRMLTDFTANGSFASLAKNVVYMDNGYARLIRLTDLRHDLKNDGLYVDQNAYNFLSKTKIRGGEILIANVGAYTGLVKLVPQINFKATLGPNMFLAIFKDKLLSSFINYQLSSICCFEQFRVQMTTTAQPKLNKDNFRSISIAIPPLSEQKAIADYLDEKTTHIDLVIETINTQIEKLKELRKTLTNDVVTGKIKVAWL